MSPGRMWLVYSVLGVILIGHSICILAKEEYWPFSRYPMYSKPHRSNTYSLLKLYAVLENGKEVPMERKHLGLPGPLVRRMLAKMKGSSAEVQEVGAETLAWIQQQRDLASAGRKNPAPPLAGIKLYQLQWKLDPRKDPKRKPDQRKVISQFNADGSVPVKAPKSPTTAPADKKKKTPKTPKAKGAQIT